MGEAIGYLVWCVFIVGLLWALVDYSRNSGVLDDHGTAADWKPGVRDDHPET